ncbi:metal-dependent hydrolase, partial [Pseudoalteromonas sp. S1649]
KVFSLSFDYKFVAFGLSGFVFYYSKDTHIVLQESFVGLIEVSKELNNPLIIHTRDAREDTINLMRAHNAENCGGVLDCFTV